jgi:hypothetical protein
LGGLSVHQECFGRTAVLRIHSFSTKILFQFLISFPFIALLWVRAFFQMLRFASDEKFSTGPPYTFTFQKCEFENKWKLK